MGYVNTITRELNDKKIVRDILKAADLYQDGCIIECRDILKDVIEAITLFEIIHQKGM